MTYNKEEYEKNKKLHHQATADYMKQNLDSILIRLPKTKIDDRPTREEIKNHCKQYGYAGTQTFIIKAIQTQMKIDAGAYLTEGILKDAQIE